MIDFYKNNFKKTCALLITFNAGSFFESKGKEGWMHFAEHMMFTGTKNIHKNKELYKKIDFYFKYLEAVTNRETVSIYCVFVIDDLEQVLHFLKEIVYDWECPKDYFQEAKKIILNEIYNYYNSYDGKNFLKSLDFLDLEKKYCPLGTYNQINKIKYSDLKKIQKFWLQKIRNSKKDILLMSSNLSKKDIKKIREIFPDKRQKKKIIKKEKISFAKKNSLAVLSFKNVKEDYWNSFLYRIFYFRWYKRYAEFIDFSSNTIGGYWFCSVKNISCSQKKFTEITENFLFEEPDKKEFEKAKKTFINYLHTIYETIDIVETMKFFYYEKDIFRTKNFYLDKNKMIKFYNNLNYKDFKKYFIKIKKTLNKKTA
jgi:hypothetical protein